MTDSAPELRYTDDEFLKFCRLERQQSIGFGDGGDSGDLTDSREKAHEYVRGEMSDVPSRPGRSAVVDTTIADAVATVLPDVIEVFFGGDDVLSFVPEDGEDEERAEEETEAVKYIIFTLNAALLAFTTAFQDAFIDRLGIFHWWWEDRKRENVREGLQPVEAQMLQDQHAQTKPWAKVEAETRDDGSVAITIAELRGKICFKAVPPEDFGAASDTVELRDTTYCVMRARPRVQELIRRGIDAEKARALPRYTAPDTVALSRDEAGESEKSEANAPDDLRQVEVRMHFIRLDADEDGEPEIWRVTTDSEEKVLLEKECVSHIPFGPLTPYVVSHRLYGRSLADVLFEVQRIKTVLWRAHLDNIYFGLNQRNEVAMARANEFTIADLLRNEPGVPVRSQTGDAVRPISAGPLNVDTLGSLEYANTVVEMRSGVVRNAQGMNPDTLHDTAGGMSKLVAAAMKRVRFMARLFAEMGVKDLALGVRRLARENHNPEEYAPNRMRLGPKRWKDYDPTQWADDREVTVHIGIGSEGREHELLVATQGLEIAERLVDRQGGMDGPLISADNIHNRLKKWSDAANERDSDRFWMDPAQAPPQQPKPDPEMMKAQAELQLKKQTAEADAQLAHGKAQSDMQLQTAKHEAQLEADARRAQNDHELGMARLEAEMQLKREQIGAELQLKREQLTAELQLKRELGFAQAAASHEVGMAKVSASTSGVEPGGEPG